MGKGKKKRGGQAQEPGSSGSSTQVTPSEEGDKRAAKKAALKQAQQESTEAGAPAQGSEAEQVPVAAAASSRESVVSPVHEAPTAGATGFAAPPGMSEGRGQGRGRGGGRGAGFQSGGRGAGFQSGGRGAGFQSGGRGAGFQSGGRGAGFQSGDGGIVGQGGSADRRQFHQPDTVQQQPFAGRGRGRQPDRPQQSFPSDQDFPPVGGARPKQTPWQIPQQPQMQAPPPGMAARPPPGMPAQSPAQSPTGMPAQSPTGFPAQVPQTSHRPQPRGPPPKQAAQQKPAPRDTKPLTEKMKSLSLDTLNIPLRPNLKQGGTEGRRTVVQTNHLKLNLSTLKNKTCVHYDVDIQPERPRRLYRAAMEAFRSKHFPNRFPAFDGRKNVIASSFLPKLVEGQELSDTVAVQDEERNSTKEFQITMKCVNIVDLTCLERYMEDGSNLEMPQIAIQMLDIVIRNAPSKRFIQVGRSFFTQPEEIRELGNGMHMWLGFYQSVTLGWKPFLNVDVAHKGFPAPKCVKDVLADLFNSYNYTIDLKRPLTQYQLSDLSGFLKGLKVEYKLPNQERTKRTYRVNSALSTATQLSFKMDNGSVTTVAAYFKNEKKYELNYPNLPCLHVGSLNRENPIYLPVELCTILPGQVTFRKLNELQTASMIKYAATSTLERKRKIQTAIDNVKFNSDRGIQEFGIVIGERFENVEARVLVAPSLTYKTGDVMPARGVWRTNTFLTGSRLQKWWVVNYGATVRQDELWKFASELVKCGRGLGMDVQQQQDIIQMDRRDNVHKLYKILEDLKGYRAELVIVIIEDKKGVYAEVKQMAELHVGLVTQCIKKRTLSRADRSTVSNVLLKINSKLNGVNHKLAAPIRPPCLRRPVMIIGADVTHPSPDQKSIPSVAAVCASHDPDAFQYNFEYRLQPPRQEIIQDLKEIMRSQLLFFHSKTKFKPERLIFYRDGVSEGQFAMVLNEELRQIRDACRSLNQTYEPQITFLVVQKRHHTRFFPIKPEDEDGKNKNVPPGTIVDTTITHPRHIDFYLVSHASIQGVSRPTKYRTLWDDSNMSVDELEKLTYYLCHLFSRCTRSVSYPAPTYYAHLAAYRARAYIEGKAINLDRLSEEQASRAIKEEVSKGNPMFFV